MKRIWTYILLIFFVVAVGAYIAFCLGISLRDNNARICNGINIILVDSLYNRFITEDEILKTISKEYGACVEMHTAEIDLTKIEEVVGQSSAVRSCEAYITQDGKLNIEISQRIPVIKFVREGGGLYADAEGFIFPMRGEDNHKAVPVRGKSPISVGDNYKGELKDAEEAEWLRNMIDLAYRLKKSPLWEDGTTYISTQPSGNVTIASDNNSVKFIIGEPKDLESKFIKIGEYFVAIVPKVGENHYKTVNVEYAGQIVCK